ncbi:MAG: Foldase protein PrsA 2 precursor [Chloroflexi bacterium ADurb.Bin360]|nr:MAG: Foldase protein PrsA 2 precursor [Chloroflexi bacterium ADurb.Bin360]
MIRQLKFLVGGALALLGLLSACSSSTLTVPPPPSMATATPTLSLPAMTVPNEETVTPEMTPTPEPLAALVNGEAITLADFERQVASYEATMSASGQDFSTTEGQTALAEARKWVLDMRIELLLINQAAAREGVVVSDADVEAAITSLVNDIGQAALEERLSQEGLTLDQMHQDLHQEMTASRMIEHMIAAVPTRAEHINARHILLATQAEAEQVLAQLRAGADFAALAQRYSQDTYTRDRGGDLGYVPRGILTAPEVETAAFSLQSGQISDVVHSALGYHIVQVVDRVPDQEISAENLRLLRDRFVREWLDGLRQQADIEVFIP